MSCREACVHTGARHGTVHYCRMLRRTQTAARIVRFVWCGDKKIHITVPTMWTSMRKHRKKTLLRDQSFKKSVPTQSELLTSHFTARGCCPNKRVARRSCTSPSSIHKRSKNLVQISKVNVHLKTVLNVLVKEDVTYGAAGFLGHMMNDELRTMDTRENEDVQLTSYMRYSLKCITILSFGPSNQVVVERPTSCATHAGERPSKFEDISFQSV